MHITKSNVCIIILLIISLNTSILIAQEKPYFIHNVDIKLEDIYPNQSKKENLLQISKQVKGFQILFTNSENQTELETNWLAKNDDLLITSVLDDLLQKTQYYYRIDNEKNIIVEPYLLWLTKMDSNLNTLNLANRQIYKNSITSHLNFFFEKFMFIGVNYKISDGIKNHIHIETNKFFNQQTKNLYQTINSPIILKKNYQDPNLYHDLTNPILDKKLNGKKMKLSEWLQLITVAIGQKNEFTINENQKKKLEQEINIETETSIKNILEKITTLSGIKIYYRNDYGIYLEEPFYTRMELISQREFRTYYIAEITNLTPYIYIKGKILELNSDIWKNIEYDIYYNQEMNLLTVACPLYLMPKIDITLQNILKE